MSKYLSLTLNVNVLNAPIKRHTIAEWIRKHDPHICCLQETHLRKKRPTQTESESLENKYSKLAESTRWGSNIYITQKRLQNRAIKKDTEGHSKILMGRIHQEDKHYKHIYAAKIRAPKYIRKILEDFKKDTDSNTIIVGDFNTPLSTMCSYSKQNINKDTAALNNALDQMDFTVII